MLLTAFKLSTLGLASDKKYLLKSQHWPQEVDRRLFRERLLRAEAEFQEKELQRMEREREVTRLRRIHEREIYVLKRRLHEATSSLQQRQQQQREAGGLGADQVTILRIENLGRKVIGLIFVIICHITIGKIYINVGKTI
jgi:hypothetical protein